MYHQLLVKMHRAMELSPDVFPKRERNIIYIALQLTERYANKQTIQISVINCMLI